MNAECLLGEVTCYITSAVFIVPNIFHYKKDFVIEKADGNFLAIDVFLKALDRLYEGGVYHVYMVIEFNGVSLLGDR